MPTEDKIGDAQQRISLIRFYNARVPGNWGTAKASPQLDKSLGETYYGDADDIGTPGYYPGSALLVVLSRFLLKRTDAGVVIQWATESELNNAGFNLLRSESRNGKFVVINPTIIPGAGTSGEKHTYSFIDKSAKSNVVYYYRIEDVSFAGEPQTLTTVRLRGHLSAACNAPRRGEI